MNEFVRTYPQVKPIHDLEGSFFEGAKKVGIQVIRVEKSQLATRLLAWTQEHKMEKIHLDPHPDNQRLGLAQFTDWTALPEESDLGITIADAALAESGTIVQTRETLASLLPKVHVAIVFKSRLLPRMLDFLQRQTHQPMPTHLTFITGPSSTADIELEFTKGVHGPLDLSYFFLPDL